MSVTSHTAIFKTIPNLKEEWAYSISAIGVRRPNLVLEFRLLQMQLLGGSCCYLSPRLTFLRPTVIPTPSIFGAAVSITLNRSRDQLWPSPLKFDV